MSGTGFTTAVSVESGRFDQWGRFAAGGSERAVLSALGELIGFPIRPVRLRVSDGSRVELDGASADASAVVQLPLRGGEFTSAHRNKIMADMFKLTWVRSVAAPHAHALLCVSSTSAGAFRPGSWLARAAADMRVTVFVWSEDALTHAAGPALS
ncbi:hypothetical protein GCM10009808_21840 [Microbacterium sediminicola]|uniref:Uncharacterized protein n=1 Tax=Microbacterium sediminicola TaxID=415210 RepID=A0ABP4UDG7_9MICO